MSEPAAAAGGRPRPLPRAPRAEGALPGGATPTAKLWELVRLTRDLTTALNYDQVLALVADAARRLLEADAAALLIEGADGLARVAAAVGVPRDRMEGFAAPLDERIDQRLAGLFGHAAGDRFVGVPLVDSRGIRGVLAIHRRRSGLHLPDEELLLSALADHAVIALLNARRVRLEVDLARTARLSGTLLAQLPTGVAILDADGRHLEVNPAYTRLVRRAAADLLGRDLAEAVPDLWSVVAPLWQQARASGAVAEARTRRVPPAPEERGAHERPAERWWDVALCPVRGAAADETQGWVVLVTEVTERVRALHQLRAERTRLRQILQVLPEGVALAEGPDGRVTYANPAAEALCGGAFEALPLARALEEGVDVHEAEAVIERPDGRRITVLANAAPLRDADGQVVGAVAVFQDITARKSLEQLKSEFIAHASHELRTPLTAARGTMLLLPRVLRGELSQSPEELIGIVVRNLDRAVRLLESLLDLSRLEGRQLAPVREPVALRALVQGVLDEVAPLAAATPISLAVDVDPGLEVVVDRSQLEQVMTNLLVNAVKFTPAGGSVAVRAERAADGVLVRVIDTGIGLTAEERVRVFEPFVQAGPRARRPQPPAARGAASRGFGLGLTICRRIVEAHGGRIWAESAGPGLGATFAFTLPDPPAPAGPRPRDGSL